MKEEKENLSETLKQQEENETATGTLSKRRKILDLSPAGPSTSQPCSSKPRLNVDGHTCEENPDGVCSGCLEFRFEYKGSIEVIVVAGMHKKVFKMEISTEVFHWLRDRAVQLRLVPKGGQHRHFRLRTKFITFEKNKTIPSESGSGHPIEIEFTIIDQ